MSASGEPDVLFDADLEYVDDHIGSNRTVSGLTNLTSSQSLSISKKPSRKDVAWDLVLLDESIQEGVYSCRCTCKKCNTTFGIWKTRPKVERVRSHTDKCYAEPAPKAQIESSMRKYTLPALTSLEKQRVSEWYYRTGTPFYKAEDDGFEDANQGLVCSITYLLRYLYTYCFNIILYHINNI